jgi:hypothetical protein
MFIPSGPDGVKVAVLSLYEMVPVKGVTTLFPATADVPVIVKDAVLIVAGFIVSLKVAEITWFKGIPTATSAGTVDTTSGHFPIVGKYVSFWHPVIKTTDIKARIATSFNVFIFFELNYCKDS